MEVGFIVADSTEAGSMVVDFREVVFMAADPLEVGSMGTDSTGTVGFIGMTVFAATSEYSSALRSSGIRFCTLTVITLTLPRLTWSGNYPRSTFRGNRITGTTVPTRVATILNIQTCPKSWQRVVPSPPQQ